MDLIASLDIFEAISGNSLEANCSILYHYYLNTKMMEYSHVAVAVA
ncbi:MAG TPA: hypothetical protein VFC05_12860 [Nitrososphaeraceae archaeon]|nr:hypothetical protein [Nitrososphaeraceae archaeon]